MEIPSNDLNAKISQVSGEIEWISDVEWISKFEVERSYKILNDLQYVPISKIEFVKWLLIQE